MHHPFVPLLILMSLPLRWSVLVRPTQLITHFKGGDMKKSLIGIAVVAIALIATGAYAFSVPTSKGNVKHSMEKNVKQGARMGVTSEVNKKIRKKNCRFKGNSETQLTCDLNAIIKDLQNAHNAMEATIANDVNVKVRAHAKTAKGNLANKRANFVRNKVRQKVGYWDYYVYGNADGSDKLEIWIEAR